jgi:hypothetical protein
VKRERLLLDHRWGEIDLADLADEKLLAAALTEAYGDALAWNHLPGLIDEVLEPRADVADSVRYFLNDRTVGGELVDRALRVVGGGPEAG